MYVRRVENLRFDILSFEIFGCGNLRFDNNVVGTRSLYSSSPRGDFNKTKVDRNQNNEKNKKSIYISKKRYHSYFCIMKQLSLFKKIVKIFCLTYNPFLLAHAVQISSLSTNTDGCRFRQVWQSSDGADRMGSIPSEWENVQCIEKSISTSFSTRVSVVFHFYFQCSVWIDEKNVVSEE
jgi:hypothetical protein